MRLKKRIVPVYNIGLTVSKPLRSNWDKKMKQKNLARQVRLRQVEIRENIAAEKSSKLQEKKEREIRRKENEKKSEVVQKIRNTAKIKRMKKKQLKKNRETRF